MRDFRGGQGDAHTFLIGTILPVSAVDIFVAVAMDVASIHVLIRPRAMAWAVLIKSRANPDGRPNSGIMTPLEASTVWVGGLSPAVDLSIAVENVHRSKPSVVS